MKREKLSDNFYRDEFDCRCGCGWDNIDRRVVSWLQVVRDALGRPVHVTSGLRCKKHNRAVGGHQYSLHRRGLAADITVRGMMPEVLMDIIQCVAHCRCGIGVYPNWRFVHFEIRSDNRRWVK